MTLRTGFMTASLVAAAFALSGPASAQDQGSTATQDTATQDSGAAQAQPGETPSLDTVMATVGDTKITFGNMLALRAGLPKQYDKLPPKLLFKGVLDQLVQQTLLMQAHEGELSTQAKLQLENERRAVTANDVIAQVMGNAVTEDDIKAAYKKQYTDATPKTEYKAAHILVKTEDEAKKIGDDLKNGADFAKLAKEKSTGPSGKSGGELGWFGEGTMVEAFYKAVTKLKPGEVSPPVKTQFGWHVIKLEKIRDAAVPPLDKMRDKIESDLRRKAFDAYIAERKAATKIDQIDLSTFNPTAINDLGQLEN